MPLRLVYSEEAILSIALRISETAHSINVTFVAIWGVSGSGKSTIAEKLSSLIPNSCIFPIDQYLSPHLNSAKFNHSPTNSAIPFIEGLDPSIWDHELINKHLLGLKSRNTINMPVFNHETRERIAYNTIQSSSIIFIEGAYSFENIVENDIAISVIIDMPFHDRFIRKLVRTYCINKRTDIEESIERYITKTEPSAIYYLNKYSKISDIIISGNSNPELEFRKFSHKNIRPPKTLTMLYPKPKYGKLHEFEIFEVLKSKIDNRFLLRYSIKNNLIFEINISIQTLNLLLIHYNLIQSTYKSRIPKYHLFD